MTGFLSFVIVFSLLIFVHELGHFLAAKLFGVRVIEFGFGYPPRIATIGRWRETEITINALPVGGFVNMAEDDPTIKGGLASKSIGARALVFGAGSLMNLMLAFALFVVTFVAGAPTPVDAPGAGIYRVDPASPAQSVGLRPGDNIAEIDGIAIEDYEQATDLIKERAGQSMELLIERNEKMLPTLSVTPRLNPPDGQGALGIVIGQPIERVAYPIWEAIPMGLRTTVGAMRGMYDGIMAMIRRQLPFEVSGPVGIYRETTLRAETGFSHLTEFAAFLSLNLFLLNLLPLPALDGGRLVFVLLEWLRGGRRIPPEKEGMVHAMGMAALLLMMVVVTYFDIVRYYG